jgi:hypothetical protein
MTTPNWNNKKFTKKVEDAGRLHPIAFIMPERKSKINTDVIGYVVLSNKKKTKVLI